MEGDTCDKGLSLEINAVLFSLMPFTSSHDEVLPFNVFSLIVSSSRF